MNSQIVLAGCSFTETKMNPAPSKWKPWSDFLHNDFSTDELEICNVGQSSAGQLLISEKIVKSIINYPGETRLVIIQWSAIGRGYHDKDMDYLGRFLNAIGNKEPHTLVDSGEFVNIESLDDGRVTSIVNQVEDTFYESSLIRIYLTHQFLKSKNIPYISFWGWEQITENQNKLLDLINLVHDENFWTFGKYGGMNEYCISKIGESSAIIPGDFHPTTESHFLFYKNIILPMLLERGFKKKVI